HAAQAAIDSGKAVIANTTGAGLPPIVRASPVFDLAGWSGDPDAPVLDQLAHAVEELAARAAAAPASAPPQPAPAPPPPLPAPPPVVAKAPPPPPPRTKAP